MNKWGKFTRSTASGIAILALAACGSQTPVASTATESAEARPATATATASVADYMAATMSARNGVDKWLSDWNENTCSSLSLEHMPCYLIMMRAGSIAGIVESTISGIQKEGVPAYVGAPPAELASSALPKTIAAADKAVSVTDEWATADCPDDYECVNVTLRTEMAMEQMLDSIDAWELYR